MDYPELLTRIGEEARAGTRRGRPAGYLSAARPHRPDAFGIAMATMDGDVHGAGEFTERFSVQSVSKVFTLALALAGGDSRWGRLWDRVGREPSGDPFNSLILLEHESGVPRNPFINAGALVVVDHLLSTGGSYEPLLGMLRAESGTDDLDIDPAVLRAEIEHSHHAAALAHLLASSGNLHHDVDLVLDAYFRQCSISMNCAELARAGLLLARHGVRQDASQLLTRTQTKQINALMLTCGTYDASGEFAYRVGLPGKSGVDGAILAVIPHHCAVCVWSPGLGPQGNSVTGVAALEALTTHTGWSIF